MATPNYGWEKRQRELAKKKKKEEKAQRKTDPKPGSSGPDAGQPNEQGAAGLGPSSSAEPTN